MKAKKLIILLSLTLGLIPCLATGITFLNQDSQGNYDSLPTDVISNGIILKQLSQDEETNSKTFTYEFDPVDTTDQNVKVTGSFKDGSSCQDYLKIETNQGTKTITLTCLKAFSQEIIVKIVHTEIPSVFAEVKVNYTKKVLSAELEKTLNEGKSQIDIVNEYSIFSKDVDYTFTVEITKLLFQEQSFSDYPKFEQLIIEAIEGQKPLPREDEIINLYPNNNNFLRLLLNSQDYIQGFEVKYECTITAYPGNQTFEDSNYLALYEESELDFTGYKIIPEGINVNPGEIDF